MDMWLNETFASFDASLLTYFHELSLQYGNILTPLAKVLNIIGDLPVLIIGWTGFLLFFVVKDKRCGIWMCGSIICGALITTIVLKNIVFRTRPYLTDVETYKTWWQAFNMQVNWDSSFPSGHSCAAMAGCLSFFCWSRKKWISWLVFLFPLIMGMSRIYLCVHFPTDVIGGYVVGTLSVIICHFVVNWMFVLFRKFPDFWFCKYCLTGKLK